MSWAEGGGGEEAVNVRLWVVLGGGGRSGAARLGMSRSMAFSLFGLRNGRIGKAGHGVLVWNWLRDGVS